MIRWEPYLWPQTRPATDEEVEAVARAWGVSLPPDYVDVARVHQGESPEPGSLRAGGTPRTVECLLTFSDGDGDGDGVGGGGAHASWHLLAVDGELRDVLPEGVHPIAAGTGGTFWCLDFRGAAAAPSVVHADPGEEPEDALHTVAPGFTAFLDALGDPADLPGPRPG